MLKRIIALLMAAAMLLACITACGQKPADDKQAEENSAKVKGMLPDIDPEDYRGTKIVEATTKYTFRSRIPNEAEEFEDKYGIEYEWISIDQSTAADEVAAMLASDKQVDLYYDMATFPYSLTVLQPIDAAGLNLESSFWNKAVIKASTVEGKTYLVDAVSSHISSLDLCVFNKRLFDEAGLTYPSELHKKGEWTFDAFKNAAKKIASLNKEYSGAGTLDETMPGVFGCRVFDFKDGKVSVAVDERYKEVLTEMAQMRVDGYLKLDRFGFDDGRQGLCLTDTYALYRRGYFTHIDPEIVGVTYLPVAEKGDPQIYTAQLEGYGLVKGAKNPVAAGIYMSHVLSLEHSDRYANSFINHEAEEFFYELTASCPEDVLYQHNTSVGRITENSLGHLGYCIMDTEPEDIAAYIDSKLPELNQMAEKLNNKIKESS